MEQTTSIGGWQPIETAPKDGSTIVLGGYGWTRRGYWAIDNFIGNGQPTWSSEDGHGCGEVTHWMPLPEPPRPKREPFPIRAAAQR